MSGQRARSAVVADHRSAHPNVPGIPWWGAVLLAVTATAIGFAVDAAFGNKELSIIFSLCYAVGCILAVLAARQAALFTAVVQPPLILFVTVPTAHYLMHRGQLSGFKDLLINCGYPLIERFPLMLFTSAAVLLIGLVRWYYAVSKGRSKQGTAVVGKPAAKATAKAATGLLAALTATLASLRRRGDASDAANDSGKPAGASRRKHPADASRTGTGRASRAARAADKTRASRKPVKRTASTRSRHARPREADLVDPVTERPRRRKPRTADAVPPPEPRRRSRTQPTREPGQQPPADRYSTYPRPERRQRLDDFQPPLPRRTNGSAGAHDTHHPISRVHYRGEEGDSGPELRIRRPRPQRAWEPEAWGYDA